ncbi:MAG: phosphohydrolase [Chloroflexota bacterium]|nr:phosphohydrolase [Chloroflexota bacterium]
MFSTSRCPGQELREVTAELHPCPTCGHEVEIFSFEVRSRCHECGTMVFKEAIPSCVEWCAAARKCLGEERWQALKGDDND